MTEHEWKDTRSGAVSSHVKRSRDQTSPELALSQPKGAHRRPGEKARIVVELGRSFEQLDGATHQSCTLLALAAKDQCHSLSHGGKEPGPTAARERCDHCEARCGRPHSVGI